MNKTAIIETAICRYDAQERCFVVQSPLFERCLGVGQTREEAERTFRELLDEFYVSYLEGNLFGYERRGRPAKGYVDLHAQVKPKIKDEIAARAKRLGISQGEIIEYLLELDQVKGEMQKLVNELDEKLKQQQPQCEAT